MIQGKRFQGFRASGLGVSVDDGPDIELSATTWLGAEVLLALTASCYLSAGFGAVEASF